VTPRILSRSRYIIAWLVVSAAVAALVILSLEGNFRAGAQTPTPIPTFPGKPSESSFPAPAEPPTKAWGGADETTVGADPVDRCPLTSPGCSAVESLLTQLGTGDVHAILGMVPNTFPIGGKTGLQVLDQLALRDTLVRARDHVGTVAVGCPQETLSGPVEDACANLFVLAIDAVPESSWTLGFVFVNNGGTFIMDRVAVQPQVDLKKGGGSASIAVPFKGTEGGVALWYTPWVR